MNEFRLEYHRDTGVRIQDHFCDDLDIEEYIEWLEEQLEEITQIDEINQLLLDRKIPIFYHGKNKRTG